MGEFAIGGILLGVSIALRVLNGYQLLEGLLGSLRRNGASIVADALLSKGFLVACGMVGLGLVVDAWRKKKNSSPPRWCHAFKSDQVVSDWDGIASVVTNSCGLPRTAESAKTAE